MKAQEEGNPAVLGVKFVFHGRPEDAKAKGFLTISFGGFRLWHWGITPRRPWHGDLFPGRLFQVVEGHVTVTHAPGWGVDIRPAWLDRGPCTEAAIENFRPSASGAHYHKGGRP